MVFANLLHLLFPPTCLYCDADTGVVDRLLCEECLSLIELLEPHHRCRYCFALACTCRLRPVTVRRGIAVAACYGPIARLMGAYERGARPALAPLFASLIAWQWLRLDLPPPDCITTSPMPLFSRLKVGYSPNRLLAKEVGKILKVPIVSHVVDKRVLLIGTQLAPLLTYAEKLQIGFPREIYVAATLLLE